LELQNDLKNSIRNKYLNMLETIRELTNTIYPKVVDWRRHLHQFPELSFQESETADYVAMQLRDMGIAFEQGIGGHGIKASLHGSAGGGKTVALRADMDALPIQELSDIPYKSKRDGVMHACGHDVHTANLLGTIWVLNQLKSKLKGTFIFIFQPAEERLPGGAALMIADGVLKNPKPDAILGLHVYPQMQAGSIGMRPGPYMASADEIYLTVKGSGGHGALPHLGVDPIWVTAQIITAAQGLISRLKDPVAPGVLTFGKLQSKGGSTNVIPDEVYLEGTFRAMNESWRMKAHELLRNLITQTAAAHGAQVDLKIDKGYPVLVNDEHCTQSVWQSCANAIGDENVAHLDIRMTAEDFAYYSHEIPSCFYRLGTAAADGTKRAALHTPYFDIDEKALQTGILTMTSAAISLSES
jgi:amidohydrolase